MPSYENQWASRRLFMANHLSYLQVIKKNMALTIHTFNNIPPSTKEQKSYQNFANTIRAPKTLQSYDNYLNKFMRFHKIKSYNALLTPNTLLIECRITQWIKED